MRVLVCGSRSFGDTRIMNTVLNGIGKEAWDYHQQRTIIISGAARGADSIAAEWATQEHGYGRLEEYPADWERLGKRAGYVRNRQMLDEGKPDVVIAFVDKPLAESKGTAMMVDLARRAGVPTYVIERVS